MKNLRSHAFDATKCRGELTEYQKLLRTKVTLSEQQDVLPFFKSRHDLSLLICTYFPEISNPDCYAHEYSIDGDFVADLVVGDATANRFVLVEFENGTPESIF